MNDYEKQVNPNNKRSKIDNTVFGNIGGMVDYHLLENYRIGNTTIKEFLSQYKDSEKKQNDTINKLIEVNNKLIDKINSLEREMEKYGLK